MAKFWDDPIMNNCTNLFSTINDLTKDVSPTFAEQISSCAKAIEKPLQQNGGEITITDARNRSAHPNEDVSIDWHSFISQFKEILGKPPAQLLSLIVK